MGKEHRLEFQFHECLGRGGFGEVYLATVKSGGITRKMAVKVLREGVHDEDDAVKRLRDEGRILGMLNHPAILGATDMCRIDGRVALVMEYVDGMDLEKACKKHRLMPQRCAVQAIGEVADALHTAWSTASPETGNPLRMVHRDVKPENVRLTTQGQIKLLDFGIARSQEMNRHAKTAMGQLPFTPGYAAPECYRRGEQGHESDVYALGATFYGLLVGEMLFEGLEIGQQFATAAKPEVYEPWLTERLGKVGVEERRALALLTKMLAYDKAARPTAKEVAERCEELAKEMSGPTLKHWVRTLQFPVLKPVADAPLAGRTILEDPPTGALAAPSRAQPTLAGVTPPAAPTRTGSTPAPAPSRARGSTPAPAPDRQKPVTLRTVTPLPAQRASGPGRASKPPKEPPASNAAGFALAGFALVATFVLGAALIVVGLALIFLMVS